MLSGEAPYQSRVERKENPMSASLSRPIATLIVIVGVGSGCVHHAPADPSAQPEVASKRTRDMVTSETIANSAGQPIEKILADRVAGVRLGRAPDGSLTVQIRGASSLNSDGQPLYVIDGVAITPGPGGSLSGINPYDIASIEVLKDAASITMYGSRGANGVIVIKMKKPSAEGARPPSAST
jgi:TonB-dependent SusC/RagA subfamily outer membrane receptor